MKASASDVGVMVPQVERRVVLDMSGVEAAALARSIRRAIPLTQDAGNTFDVARLRALANALTAMALTTSPTNGVFEVES